MLVRGFIAFGALGASILLTLGCGGTADGERGESNAPSKVAFIRQADAICEAIDEAQKSAQRRFEREFPAADAGRLWREKLILEAGLPPIRQAAKEIGALPPPRGDGKEIEAIVDGLNESIDEAEADLSSMLVRSAGPFADVSRLAKAYGFKACSTPI